MSDLVVVEEIGATVVIQEVAAANIIEVVAAGPQGASATTTVGTVTTLSPGQPVQITNAGTPSAAILNFGIPQGAKGDTGDVTPEALLAKTQAETAAASASSSASSASISASSASTSASNAGTSATTASTKAGEALSSANAAAASATTATTKASEASAAATAAASSAIAAGTSATNAANSATAAAGSATTAAGSAATATTKASDAATLATNAATSATAASSSATSAAASATTATTKASEASTSASNAATSATAAASSASAASTSASNAATSASGASTSASTATSQAAVATTKAGESATSATNAANSATAAASSATSASSNAATATTQAGIATTKAGDASTSASNAATSATNAAGSASSAATSATNAAGSATTASTQATNASNSATSAAGSATSAASSATSASNSATTATTQATNAASSATAAATAKTGAEAARDSALAAFANFNDQYLGSKTSDPTTDNTGGPLASGNLYYNSNSMAAGGGMKVYDGSVWLAAYSSLSGALLAANNLSDLSSATSARTNLGLGNVENKSSATIRGELTSLNVTTALGFTPYNSSNPSGYITSAALSPYLTSSVAAATYQPLDGDLTSIAGLVGTSGILKKTAANTWALDTSTYLTGITSSDVTTALGFTPYNATNPSGYITSSALTPYLTTSSASSTYAPLASPTLTGTPAAPTAAVDTNTTQLATTAYVIGQGYLKSSTAASTYQTQAGMSSYLTTATAASTYQTQSGMSSYLTTSSASSTYLPLAGGTLTGGLAFSGTGLRITGDFSNGTVASRTAFQTSTTNGQTLLTVIPNGTAVNSQVQVYNSSNPDNASIGALVASSSQVRIVSGYIGTGALNPITFIFSNTEAARFDPTTKNFLIGTSTDNATDKLQVNGSLTTTKVSVTGAGQALLGYTASDALIYSQFQNSGGTLYVGRDDSAGNFWGVAGAHIISGTGNSNPLVFGVNGIMAMRLMPATRNLLIGTATDNATDKLQVNGSASVAGLVQSTTGGFKFPDGTVQTTAASGSGGGSLQVLDEGATLTSAAASINFVGSGVTATTSGGAVTVTIPGASGGGGATLADVIALSIALG